LIHGEIELVQMTHNEALNYVPPAGIDVNFIEWQDEKGKKITEPKFMPFAKQVVMEFLCSDLQPDPVLRKSLKDIHHELLTNDYLRNHVLKRNLGSQEKIKNIKRRMMVEVNLANPMIREAPAEIRRAAEEATDVHDVLYSPEEIENAYVESSFKFDQYSMPRLGGSGEYTRRLKFPEPGPGNVVQERFYRQVGPEQELIEELGPEMLKYQMGVIDIG
jgi:hypothetical protein